MYISICHLSIYLQEKLDKTWAILKFVLNNVSNKVDFCFPFVLTSINCL